MLKIPSLIHQRNIAQEAIITYEYEECDECEGADDYGYCANCYFTLQELQAKFDETLGHTRCGV